MGLPDMQQVNALGSSLCVCATIVTLWRLYFRYRVHKLWWDDAWAAFSMFNGFLVIVSVWVIFAPPGAAHVHQRARVACFYLLEVCFTFTVWSSRMSILWTIVRITPDKAVLPPSSALSTPSSPISAAASVYSFSSSKPISPIKGTVHSIFKPLPDTPKRKRDFRITRPFLYSIAVLFGLFTIILCAQKFWVCAGQRTPVDWAKTPGAFCSLGKQVAILEIITDVTGDLILVVLPIKLLYTLRLFSRALQIRLVAVFTMSLATTAVSLCMNYYLIVDGGVRDFIVSHVEAYTAVFVCNLTVIVGAIYRWRHREVALEPEGGESNTGIRFATANGADAQSMQSRYTTWSRKSTTRSVKSAKSGRSGRRERRTVGSLSGDELRIHARLGSDANGRVIHRSHREPNRPALSPITLNFRPEPSLQGSVGRSEGGDESLSMRIQWAPLVGTPPRSPGGSDRFSPIREACHRYGMEFSACTALTVDETSSTPSREVFGMRDFVPPTLPIPPPETIRVDWEDSELELPVIYRTNSNRYGRTDLEGGPRSKFSWS